MFDPDSDSTFVASHQQPASRNYAKFYRQWVRNNFKSNEQGCEVGEEQDFIIIVCPGQPKSEVRRKANDADKQLYPREWAAYLEGKEHQVSGTPIELLPGLPSGMAGALKARYVYTIEQMAELSDVAVQQVGMGGNDLRSKAKAYLAGGTEQMVKLREELETARLTITTQRTTIEALEARVRELEAVKPKGRRKAEVRLAS